VPSLDLSSNSGTLDDAFDPMIASYHSDEQEDASNLYSKQSNTERLPLSSIVNDSSQCSRGSSGGTSFSRFIDPIQESLCA
jgi:meiosis-specific transcription factor NDT80